MNINQFLPCPYCGAECVYNINHEKMADERLVHCSNEIESCGKYFVIFFEIEHKFKIAKLDKIKVLK